MEAFFWTMLGAFVLGMTGLAYKEPSHYQKLYPFLLLGVFVTLIIGLIYFAGFTKGTLEYYKFLSSKNLSEPVPLFDGRAFPFDGFSAWMLGSALIGYFMVLSWLPQLLGSSVKKSE